MFKKSLLVSLLAFSLIAFLANEAPALLRGGTGGSGTACDCYPLTPTPPCTLCGKCVEGYVRATGLGNVENTPTFIILTVNVQQEADKPVPAWAVICGNPGNNYWPAPGVNVTYYETAFAGIETINPEDVLKNGSTYITVPAEPTDEMLDALVSGCPNDQWYVWDALPCDSTDAIFEEIILVEGACYLRSRLTYNNCYIQGCPGSMEWQWDSVNQKFTFVPIPYVCNEAPVLENYSKNPIPLSECPPGIPQ